MASPARDSYLATEVLTAPPQRLHLMLIEAAIRCAERARQCWRANQPEQATEAVVHAEEIVGELLAGLNRETGGNLIRKTAAVYLFVFRTLMEANLGRDEGKLDDALRVLAIERETWRRVCGQIGAGGGGREAGGGGRDVEGPALSSRLSTLDSSPVDAPSAEHCSGRFSLDA